MYSTWCSFEISGGNVVRYWWKLLEWLGYDMWGITVGWIFVCLFEDAPGSKCGRLFGHVCCHILSSFGRWQDAQKTMLSRTFRTPTMQQARQGQHQRQRLLSGGCISSPLRRRPKRIKTTGSQVKLRSSMVQSLSTCKMNCQARWLPAANGYDATDSKSARPKCPKRLNLRTMLALAMDMVGKS